MATRITFLDRVGGAEGLRRLYVDEGLTAAAIAQRFGVHPEIPRRQLRRHGIANRHAAIRDLKRQVRALLLEGASEFRELRDLLGPRVHHALWEMKRGQGYVEPAAIALREEREPGQPGRSGRPSYIWRLTPRGETVARMEAAPSGRRNHRIAA